MKRILEIIFFATIVPYNARYLRLNTPSETKKLYTDITENHHWEHF
jgi:hypothetical protein